MSTRPSRTASNVPGGAAGALGSELNLTRPLVAFSTSAAQFACQMVRWCVGGTQLEYVSETCACAGAVIAPAASAASARWLTFVIMDSLLSRNDKCL